MELPSVTAPSTLLIPLCVVFFWLLFKHFRRPARIKATEDKFVFVTGSSSGFGLELVIRLDQLGFRVFASCRTESGEKIVRASCSDRVKTFVLDVTDATQIQDVYTQVKQQIPPGKGLWALVNNAGVLHAGIIDWLPLDLFKRTADVNLWGLIAVTKTFLPLVKTRKGRVVNMGSVLGRITMPYLSGYCISKYGIEAFSDGLRREMYPWGVNVIVIEAGAHRTKLLSGQYLSSQWEELWEGLDAEQKEEYGEEALRKGMSDLQRFDSMTSTKTSQVIDAIEDALTHCKPKARYVIGLDAKALLCLLWFPTHLVDWCLRLMVKTFGQKNNKSLK